MEDGKVCKVASGGWEDEGVAGGDKEGDEEGLRGVLEGV